MTELIAYPIQEHKPLKSEGDYPQLLIDSAKLFDFTISVVIPVRNGDKCISECLDAVFSQSLPPTEVIVVDGGSTDNTIEVALQYPVKVVHEEYGTVGGARQAGVENATGKYVAFTDADCIPEEDWLKNLVSQFKDDTLGVGGGIKNIGNNLWENAVAFSRDTFLGSANSVQGRVFSKKRFVSSISGCNSIYSRENLLSIGGFNTKLSMNEDTELNKRLMMKGKLLYTPNANVIHNQRRGLKAFAKQMVAYGRGRGKNRLWALQCIPPLAAPFLLLPLLLAGYLLPAFAALYIGVLLAIGAKIAVKNRDLKYLVTMPVVFATEHFSYTAGFWAGLFEGLNK